MKMNGYWSKRRAGGAERFHTTQVIRTTVIHTRNRPVPRKRATLSDNRPNASGSYAGSRVRLCVRGTSSRVRALVSVLSVAMGALPLLAAPPARRQIPAAWLVVHRVTPVVRQQMVKYVV